VPLLRDWQRRCYRKFGSMNSIICQIPILGKFKKIKGPCTTTSKYCFINYAYFRSHQRRSRTKFGSTRTIFECYHIPGPWKNKHPLHLKTCNIVLRVITSCLTCPKYHSRPCYYINYTDFKKCLDIFDNQTTLHMVAMCDNSRILYNNLIYKSSIHIHTTS